MAGFYLSNNQITANGIRNIYGGLKPLKVSSPRESKTFYLRCKEKEEERVEAMRRRTVRHLFDRNSRGEFVVPKAPAFNEVNYDSVNDIVTRLNRPKTATNCHHSDKSKSEREKRRAKSAKPVTERDLSNISARLHGHETYMSRVRSSRGVRLPPPRRRSALERANSAPAHRTDFAEIIKKWNLHH